MWNDATDGLIPTVVQTAHLCHHSLNPDLLYPVFRVVQYSADWPKHFQLIFSTVSVVDVAEVCRKRTPQHVVRLIVVRTRNPGKVD